MIGFTKLDMEEIFIATYGIATIIGLITGMLTYFIFKHDNKEK